MEPNPKNSILESFIPKSNQTSEDIFAPVFLAHARLYCFAHVRLIKPLEVLVLGKLHKTLMEFKLFSERVGDVLELARYVYSNANTPDRTLDGKIDDLRQLVVEYIACEIDTIGQSKGFTELMEEGVEFVGDFWGLARTFLMVH